MSKIKKYFCYYCQENTEPRLGLNGKFCPRCGCYLLDENTDFFRVCDKCGANLPPDAAVCLLCGYHFSGNNAQKVYHLKKCAFVRAKKDKAEKRKNTVDFKAALAKVGIFENKAESDFWLWAALAVCALVFVFSALLLISR
ncbi:MAG: hypothetical protein IKN71_04350 [Alphaproteobacteria bacterium]|nr:hypothetical protein [Alphaproteobacteria bacterium]